MKEEEEGEGDGEGGVGGYDGEKWMRMGGGELGMKEYGGKLKKKGGIIEYEKRRWVGGCEDEVWWCGGLVGWVMIEGG